MRSPLILLLLLAACRGPEDTDTDDSGTPIFDDDLGVVCPVRGEALPTPPTPVPSFPFLPTSNGWVSAQYVVEAIGVPVHFLDGTSGTADQRHQLATFTDHLPAQPTPLTHTRDLLWDLYLGVKVDGTGTWLNTVAEQEVGYVAGTNIVRVVQVVGDIEVETFTFAPFQAGATRDLVVVATVHNGGSVAAEVDLYSLQNAHTGGEGHADEESAVASGDGILESRSADRLLHSPLGTPVLRAAAPGGDSRNPWMRLTNDEDLDGSLVSGDDVAMGFQWDLDTLGPGASATRGLVLSWDDQPDLPARVAGFVGGRDAAAILAAEKADWVAFHAEETPPPGLSEDETAVYRQSTAVLRMGQVRETGPGRGQILASLPPGQWNISWPRDAAYAIAGLVAAGHQDMARDALAFMIDGDAGTYASTLGLDDYLISVARYYGDGTEESDGATCPGGADAGPNIELDNFGLFLWAYGTYADRWSDDPWVAETLPAVLTGVADPLLALIDDDNDLLVRDSSIWERHWYDCFPNGRKQFSYSAIQAVAGLRAAAALSANPTYASAAERIRGGLLGPASDGGPVLFWETPSGDTCPLLASAPQEICTGCGPYDGAVIELINQGVVRPQSSLAVGTLLGLQQALHMANGSPGFLRNDDGNGTTNPFPWYDDQEWVVIDLRMAVAQARVAAATDDDTLHANAETLLAWVTAQARANHGLIAELLSDGTWTADDDADHVRPGQDLGREYQGAVPMCGFGPGAYILALEALRG